MTWKHWWFLIFKSVYFLLRVDASRRQNCLEHSNESILWELKSTTKRDRSFMLISSAIRQKTVFVALKHEMPLKIQTGECWITSPTNHKSMKALKKFLFRWRIPSKIFHAAAAAVKQIERHELLRKPALIESPREKLHQLIPNDVVQTIQRRWPTIRSAN